jgi:hypothetical protein
MAVSPPADAHADAHAHATAQGADDEATLLAPRFWVPLGVMALGALALAATSRWSGAPWVGLPLLVFGAFLLLQAAILRLSFSAEALLVLRAGQEIRRFPYDAWLDWRLFLPALPVLFYFRERRSPHLLPVLFDATVLRAELERRIPLPVPPQP